MLRSLENSSAAIETTVSELFDFCRTQSPSVVTTKHKKQLACQQAVRAQGNGCYTLRYDLTPYSKKFSRLQVTEIGALIYLTFKEKTSPENKDNESKKHYFVCDSSAVETLISNLISKVNSTISDNHLQVMLPKQQRLKKYETPKGLDGGSLWDIRWEELTPAKPKYLALDQMILEALAKRPLLVNPTKKTIRMVNIAGGTARGIRDVVDLLLSTYKGYSIDYVHIDSSELSCHIAKQRLEQIAKEDCFRDKFTYKIDCQFFDEAYAASLENSADLILSEGGIINSNVAPDYTNAARFFNLFPKMLVPNGLCLLCGATPILLIDKDFSHHSFNVMDMSKESSCGNRYQFYVLRKKDLENESKHSEEMDLLSGEKATFAQETLNKIVARITKAKEEARIKKLEEEEKQKVTEEKQRELRMKAQIEEEKKLKAREEAIALEKKKEEERQQEEKRKHDAQNNLEIKNTASGKLLDEIAYRDITIEQGHAILKRYKPGSYLIVANPGTYQEFTVVRYKIDGTLQSDNYSFLESWEEEAGHQEPRFGSGRTLRDLMSVLKTNLDLDCITPSGPRVVVSSVSATSTLAPHQEERKSDPAPSSSFPTQFFSTPTRRSRKSDIEIFKEIYCEPDQKDSLARLDKLLKNYTKKF